EEKLSQMYNEIADEISGMIPVEWDNIYTIAYVTDQGGEVIFNYTQPGSDELNYYTYSPREFNVSEKVFYDLWTDLYRLF
ncbi:TIGR01741 family protein, partial [Staphylococcus aureus]|nr:TIGR01741 family protein [Staphylococcus aureus]